MRFYNIIKRIILFVSIFLLTTSLKKGEEQTAANNLLYAQPIDSAIARNIDMDSCIIGLNIHKTWSFDYKDETFPNDTICECVIKGLAIESDSVFYIIGGNPAFIAKYNGTTLLNRKRIDIDFDKSYNALCQIYDDSVYFISEQNKVIYSLDNKFNSSATAYNLPMEAEDSIVSGRMEHDSYILVTQKKNTHGTNSANFTTWHFCYPNHIKKKYTEETNLYAHIPGYVPLREPENNFFYHGIIDGYRLFLTPPEYDNCSIIVADASGDCIYKDTFKQLPPIAAVSGYEEHYGALQSENLRVVSKNSLYMTGYNNDTHQFYILEYRIFK
ncbi:MAG: hypothetical protein J1F40_05445 [Prevotellaceae bacterium]|nr:hypothetical protein [Prevotellaceae bacterium]